MESLRKMNKQGKTVIVVTHDIELKKYANKVIHIENGCLVKG